MKILLCHNHYQHLGGEDLSFAAEAKMLEDRGHQVFRFTLHNDTIHEMSRWQVAKQTFWNSEVYADVQKLIREVRPDVMHCTNTFPLISPAVYSAARSEKVPVVQSLRNYRMMCPGALFLRDGKVCEDCLGKSVPWPAIRHRCYRSSRAGSAVVTAMLAWHRWLGTWKNQVDLYFTPSEFARHKHIEGGLPAERIVVKPNFIDPDPGAGTGQGGYSIFVGRLSEEKGIDVLLRAWEQLGTAYPLQIVGDGPLADRVRESAERHSHIEWLGKRAHAEVLARIGEANCLVMPSLWYETFGRTIVEAYARGTPVIVSRLGAMQELVTEGQTGWLVEPGDADELAVAVRAMLRDEGRLRQLRSAARAAYESKYTAEHNYQMLMGIYHQVLRRVVPGTENKLVSSATPLLSEASL